MLNSSVRFPFLWCDLNFTNFIKETDIVVEDVINKYSEQSISKEEPIVVACYCNDFK